LSFNQAISGVVDQIYGFKELAPTESPGATWEQWRATLLDKVRNLTVSGIETTLATPTPTPASGK
jgi:hypothetical protein